MSSFFFENPWAIAFAGILLVTALAGSWLQTGKNGLMMGAIFAGLLTGLLLFVERSVVTENERVEATIHQLAKIVEAGDLSALIAHIHPEAAEVRARASQEFPRYKIKEVRIKSGMKVEVSPNHEPPKAVAEFNVVVVGGDAVGLVVDQSVPRFVVLTFYKDGGEWKVWNYEHHEFTHGMSGAGANP